MIKLLTSLLSSIGLLLTFLWNTLQSLLTFIIMIPEYITYLTSMTAVVPSFATAYFIAGISLTVILFMIGKESS